MKTLGVLLAGGKGRRLGQRVPKALVLCGGRTLLARGVAMLESLCNAVVVVAPSDVDLPVAAGQRIVDPSGAEGPLAGLVAGLGSREFEEALVLAVDMPLLRREALAALRARRGDAPAVLGAPAGIPQPLAAWYAPRAVSSLAAAWSSGERSASRAALLLAPVLVDDETLAGMPGGLEAWLNVNTPSDLAEAERRLAAAAADPEAS